MPDARRAALVVYPDRAEDIMVSLRHLRFWHNDKQVVKRPRWAIKPIESEVERIIVRSEYYQDRRYWGRVELPAWGIMFAPHKDGHVTLVGCRQDGGMGGDGLILDNLVTLIDDIDAGWLDIVKQYVA